MASVAGPAPDVCPLKPPRHAVGGRYKFLIWRDDDGWVVARGFAVTTYTIPTGAEDDEFTIEFTMWHFEPLTWGLSRWRHALDYPRHFNERPADG